MRKEDIIFQESQKFSWTKILPLVVICIIFISVFISQLLFGKRYFYMPISYFTIMGMFFLLLSFFTEMHTIIDNTGVYVKIFPLHLKYKYFSWDEISITSFVTIKPNLVKVKFIRIGPIQIDPNKNVTYNMFGNTVLQLQLKKGNKILIGTQKPIELAETLRELEVEGINYDRKKGE